MVTAGMAATASTGSAVVMATAFLGTVITTIIAIFFAYNSCWKWSPYGPVNVCNRYY
jgi:ABC-type phosphate/phosphonate transport system permease subunit